MADPLIWVWSMFFSGTGMGIVIGLGGTILFGLVQRRRWPVRLPISIQRGEGGSVVWDLDERGKFVQRKDGYSILRMKKRKKNIKPPKFSQVTLDTKGKPVYPLYNTTVGQYLPMKLSNPPKMEVVSDLSAKNWGVLESARIRSTYIERESTFMRIAPYVMNGIFAAMVIFFVIYFGGKMESAAGSLGSAASSLEGAIKTMFSGGAPSPPPA